MAKKFEYRGDLALVPLAEIFATIHRYKVPGVVSLLRDGRVRQIFIDEDCVTSASSNEREVSLGMHLLKRGILTPDTAREAEARRARDGLRLGQILLQMGIVTPERLNEAVAEQVREILWGAFDWESGEVRFDVGVRPAGELVRLDLSMPAVILEGIRRTADVRRLVQRLGSSATILEKTPGVLLELFEPSEKAFYEKIDGRTPLQPLCARGPGSVAEAARLLYAFYCLGLVRKARPTGPGARKIQYRTEGGHVG